MSKLMLCSVALICATALCRVSMAAAEATAAAKDSPKTAAEATTSETLAAAGKKHEAELGTPEKAGGVEEVKTDLAIWTFAVFIVLLAILWKFAWGPIVAGLAKREQRIADNIAAAERANEQAKQMLAEYDKKLASAADQVRQMMDEARKEAEQTKVEIVAEAKEAAKLEFDRSKRDLQRATDQALKELSERSTNLAVDLAGKIVRERLNQQDHARLVQEAMTEFVSNGPSVN
jgi:F-type H+-transporting ATPase subunit b